MIHCSNCGKETQKNEKFCSNCGATINIEKKTNSNNKKEIKNNELSIAGFVVSLGGLLLCGLTAPIGLILSIIGLIKSIKHNQKKGLAIAGTIISSILTLLLIIVISYFLVSAETIKVEDFSTMTYDEANEFCEKSPLNCHFTERYSDSVPKGQFISQSIEPGKEIKSYEIIDIIYSKGNNEEQQKSDDSNKKTQEKNSSDDTKEKSSNDDKKNNSSSSVMDSLRKCTVMEAADLYTTGGAKIGENVFDKGRETCLLWYKEWGEDEFIKLVDHDWKNRQNEEIEGKTLSYYLDTLGW